MIDNKVLPIFLIFPSPPFDLGIKGKQPYTEKPDFSTTILACSDWMVNLQELASDLRNYFECCPVCFASTKGIFNVHLTAGDKDTLACNICGAKWNLYIVPFRGLEWAELDLIAKDGNGQELLAKRLGKHEILEITSRERDNQKKQSVITKEIIKEKEIVTKVRCTYCHGTYNELLDSCPHCGAKN